MVQLLVPSRASPEVTSYQVPWNPVHTCPYAWCPSASTSHTQIVVGAQLSKHVGLVIVSPPELREMTVHVIASLNFAKTGTPVQSLIVVLPSIVDTCGHSS